MAYTNTKFYSLIATAIRSKLDTSEKYYPGQMAVAIGSIPLRTDGLTSKINGDYIYYGHLIIDYNIGITNTQNYTNIANSIRSCLGTDATYYPEEMPDAIFSIPSANDPTGEYSDGDLILYGSDSL